MCNKFMQHDTCAGVAAKNCLVSLVESHRYFHGKVTGSLTCDCKKETVLLEQKIFIRKTEEEVVCGLKKEPIAYRTYFGWNEELRERFLSFCMGKKPCRCFMIRCLNVC